MVVAFAVSLFTHTRARLSLLRKLNDVLMAVSDPSSDMYGKHLSLEQLAALVSPNDQVVAQVKSLERRLIVSLCVFFF